MLRQGMEMVQECIGPVMGKVIWAGVTWDKTINHDLYLLPFMLQ